MSHFGERLRALREERGLTQVQLAAAAEIAVATISRLENDYHPNKRPGRVSVGTLEKVARVLNVPVAALLDEETKAPSGS